MVKLIEFSERRGRVARSHRVWGVRFGRLRDEMLGVEPTTLTELETLATRAVVLMEKHTPRNKNNFAMAMDMLRQQYNMNFMILCDKCEGTHSHDELSAPER